MPEIKREVRPVEVNYVCDACGQGMMTRSGDMERHAIVAGKHADATPSELNGCSEP